MYTQPEPKRRAFCLVNSVIIAYPDLVPFKELILDSESENLDDNNIYINRAELVYNRGYTINMNEEGVFSDVVGLSYRCGSLEGVTTADGKYRYEPGKLLTFSIGELIIGESIGKPLLTVSDLASKDTLEFTSKLVNRARLLYSLTPAQGFEAPIVINAKVSDYGWLKRPIF